MINMSWGVVPLLVACLLSVGGWLIAQSRDEGTGLPRTGTTRIGSLLAGVGLVVGVLAAPANLSPMMYAASLGGVIALGVLMWRAASSQAIGWTAFGEVATTAIGMSWSGGRRAVVALTCAAVGLSLGVWLAGQGSPVAAVLGALVALAPARWWLKSASRRERNRTAVERATAGALAGGQEWDAAMSARRGAPVSVAFDADQEPTRVMFPLPPQWRSTDQDRLGEELGARLADFGGPWLLEVQSGSARTRATITRGERLPTLLKARPTPLEGMKIPLGLARISVEAARAGIGSRGSLTPFVWDAEDSPSGLIVGTTGGGKSVLVRLIVAMWARYVGQVILIDPKRVEFSIFRGRKNVLAVATTLEQMTERLVALNTEMDRRFALMEEAGVQHVRDLPGPPQPELLAVVDEAFELLAQNKGSDDATKAENALRGLCAGSTRGTAALGRAAGIHIILLAQRADAEVVAGALQNNLVFRALLRPASAKAITRNMIGLNEVEVAENPKGRAVMMTAAWPECEVQVAYLDAGDLDEWMPREPADAPQGGSAVTIPVGEGDAGPEADQAPSGPAAPRNDGPGVESRMASGSAGTVYTPRAPRDSADPAGPEDDSPALDWDFMGDFDG